MCGSVAKERLFKILKFKLVTMQTKNGKLEKIAKKDKKKQKKELLLKQYYEYQ